jgi:inhibitor of KinA sporulation pathway (predicted exonuclease)
MEGSESQEALSVYERSLHGIPKSTIDRATAAKLKLEAFYKILLEQTRERDVRYRTSPIAPPSCAHGLMPLV